jgi:lysophospholipase L1-like esterase
VPTWQRFRVLCYGDSLTVGFCADGRQYEPYGRSLAEALSKAFDGTTCEVSVCGHSGHTAAEMVRNLDTLAVQDVAGVVAKGLRRTLRDEARRPDIVLIMTGTNDLGLHGRPETILDDTCKLHAECHSRGIPTVVLPPPPAPRAMGATRFEGERRKLHGLLSSWATSAPGVSSFIDPNELVPAVLGSRFWDPDGLHFSPAGSRLLGQHLVPALLPLLLTAAKSNATSMTSMLLPTSTSGTTLTLNGGYIKKPPWSGEQSMVYLR